MEIGLYGTLFGQAPWKFQLEIVQQGGYKVKFPLH